MWTFFISFGLARRNLGVVCTEAEDEKAALEKVDRLGLNPGGEAAIGRVPPETLELPRDRLLSPEEMRRQGFESRRDKPEVDYLEFMEGATLVCRACNEGRCSTHKKQ